MNKFSIFTALAVASTTSLQATADNETTTRNKMEELVVTSSRVPMPLRQIGTSVSVITQQDIAELGFNSIYDVLRTQPSIGVTNSGGAGQQTTLRIRGEEGFRTLVLLDGIDLSNTSTPQVSTQFEHLLSSGIQRVEILRGPQGLMYGADAGGVVNIYPGTTGRPRWRSVSRGRSLRQPTVCRQPGRRQWHGGFQSVSSRL